MVLAEWRGGERAGVNGIDGFPLAPIVLRQSGFGRKRSSGRLIFVQNIDGLAQAIRRDPTGTLDQPLAGAGGRRLACIRRLRMQRADQGWAYEGWRRRFAV